MALLWGRPCSHQHQLSHHVHYGLQGGCLAPARGLTPPTLPRVFKLGRDQLVATVSQFIVKRLRLDLGPFLYLQSSFQVNPDDNIGQLYELYRTGDELIFSYCTTAAFG